MHSKFDNDNNIHVKINNVMCIQLNNAFYRLYQAFDIKSATYFTNLSLIKKVIKSILDMTGIFITVGSIELII